MDTIPEAIATLIESLPDDTLESFLAASKNDECLGDVLGLGVSQRATIEGYALGLYRGTKYGDAARLYGLLIQLEPKRATAWRGLAACAQAQKDYATAVPAYARAVELAPSDAISRSMLGECQCLSGDRDEGLKTLQALVDVADSLLPHEEPYVIRARALVAAGGDTPMRVTIEKEGRDVVAKAALEEHGPVEEAPERDISLDDIRAHPELNTLFREVEDAFSKGLLTLSEVGGFTDDELDGTYAVACQQAGAGQFSEALRTCGYLMLVHPYRAKPYQLAGICLQRMELLEQCEVYYRLALALEPDDPRTLVYFGEVLIYLGRRDDGLEMLEKASNILKDQDDPENLEQRISALNQQFAG